MNEQWVCHYTDLDAVKNILETKKIFATSLLCLNDSKEFKYAKELTQNIIKERIKRKLTDKEFSAAMNIIFDPKKGGYIFCTSKYENDDGMLSMWRAYGKRNEGIGIVFPIYNKDNKKTLNTFVKYEKKLTPEDEKKIDSPEVCEFLTQIVNGQLNINNDAAVRSILSVALKYKHPGFKEEQEYRFCFCEGESKTRTIPRSKKEVNYVEWDIDVKKDIVKLIIGPSSDQKKLEKELNIILKENNISKEIIKSEIPFVWDA